MSKYIIVIGAGLVGCITAIQLAEQGYQVTLIERKTEIMSGTSRIPLHLHQGGMYVCDANNDQTLHDCLTDTEAFRQVLGDAIISRPMAFTVIAGTRCIPPVQDSEQQAQALKMQAGFIKLSDIARSHQIHYPHKTYDVARLKVLKEQQTVIEDLFDVYAKRFADAVVLDTISGMVMTNESGLNMVRAKGILTQKLSTFGVRVYTSTTVTQLSQNETSGYSVSGLGPGQQTYQLTCDQVINATGHAGFQIDAMACNEGIVGEGDIPKSWYVDAKGIGIVIVSEKHRTQVAGLPEICFMHGRGMSHFAPLPNGRAGVTFSDRTGTQISRVEVNMTDYRGAHHQAIDERMSELNQFFDRQVNDPELLRRTEACVRRCATFIPMLSDAKPELYLPGALGVVNPTATAAARSSQRVYCSHAGYHSVNAVKGGGAVSAANMAVEHVLDASLHRSVQIRTQIMELIKQKENEVKAIKPEAGATSEQASKRKEIARLEKDIANLTQEVASINVAIQDKRISRLRQSLSPADLRSRIAQLDDEIAPVGKASPSGEMKNKLREERAEYQRALEAIGEQQTKTNPNYGFR